MKRDGTYCIFFTNEFSFNEMSRKDNNFKAEEDASNLRYNVCVMSTVSSKLESVFFMLSNPREQMMLTAVIICMLICIGILIYIHFHRISLMFMFWSAWILLIILDWGALSADWNKPFSYVLNPPKQEERINVNNTYYERRHLF